MPSLLSEDISMKIQCKIEEGEYIEHQKLPSERNMAEYYKVSRNVIREALKILSEKGLVQIYSGKGGFVSCPSDTEITGKLEEVIKNSNTSLFEILEIREILETAILERAVYVASDKNIESLESYYNEMNRSKRNGRQFSELDTKFHNEIANCSGNRILTVLTKTFYNVADQNLFKVVELNPQKLTQAQREHNEIILAIKTKDSIRAISALKRHMECIRNQLFNSQNT